jgi:hypothetical protein
LSVASSGRTATTLVGTLASLLTAQVSTNGLEDTRSSAVARVRLEDRPFASVLDGELVWVVLAPRASRTIPDTVPTSILPPSFPYTVAGPERLERSDLVLPLSIGPWPLDGQTSRELLSAPVIDHFFAAWAEDVIKEPDLQRPLA